MIRLISPENGAKFSVLTDEQKELIRRCDEGTFTRFGNYEGENGDDASAPAVCVFRWATDDAEFPSYLEISEKADFSADTYLDVSDVFQSGTGGEKFALARNFCTGRTYFWRVRQNGVFSETRTLSTLPDRFRPIYVERVPNFRDLGGKTNAEGRRVKQGMLYRGKFLERRPDEGLGLTEKGQSTFAEKLGIKTEIDLREEMAGKFSASPAGDGVRYVFVAHDSSWGGTFNDRGMGQLREIFDVLFDPDSYPVYFHCFAGADRTGFVSVIIDGILGLKDEDIILDYDLTALYEHRKWEECDDTTAYFAFLRETFGDRPLSELITMHMEKYGIDKEKLDRFRDFMLE